MILEYLNSKLNSLRTYKSKSSEVTSLIEIDSLNKNKIDTFLKMYNDNSLSIFPDKIKEVFQIINLEYTNLFEQAIKLKLLISNDDKLSLKLNKNQNEMVMIFETKLDNFLKNLNNNLEHNKTKLKKYTNDDNKNNTEILKIKKYINIYENKNSVFDADIVNEIYYDQLMSVDEKEKLLIEILNFNNLVKIF